MTTSKGQSVAGIGRRRHAQGVKADELQRDLESLDAGVARWANSFVFGEVWAREGMSHKERMLVAIASLASQGHLAQLRNYLFGALQAGVEPEKVQEALVMLVVYCGFPVAIQALSVWRDVRQAAARRGMPS